MADLFEGLIFQVLQHSGGLFSDFSKQLNLSKIQSHPTEDEWVALVCLLFSKASKSLHIYRDGGSPQGEHPRSQLGSTVLWVSSDYCRPKLRSWQLIEAASRHLRKRLSSWHGLIKIEECSCYDTATADADTSALVTYSAPFRPGCQRLGISKTVTANPELSALHSTRSTTGAVPSSILLVLPSSSVSITDESKYSGQSGRGWSAMTASSSWRELL
jgi:hypothetical protein